MLPGAEVIERAGLKAWPGIEVEWDGSWVRRAAGGYTKRANSVQSLDVSDDGNAAARIDAAKAWFQTRGLRPVFRITPLTGPSTIAALDVAGWANIDHSQLLAMELGETQPDPRGRISELLDPAFLAAQQRLQGYSEETLGRLKAVIGALDVPARGIVLHGPDNSPVASAIMAVADGIAITGNVVTDPTERRKGHGVAMMRTGLAWAAENGATVAALNVAAANPAAHALYRSLGYERQYDYVYRVPQ